MPYNTTAIPPRKAATGQTQLPLSRVRKIIALDPDVAICSSNAAFVITLATELFLQYITTEGQNMTKLDRKPRRNLQYRDLANAVSRIDRLEFLEDTIPTTVPFGKIKNDASALQTKIRRGFNGGVDNGTRGADGGKGSGSGAGTGGSGKAGGAGRSKGRSSAGGAPPTAISALMADGSAPEAEGTGSGSKKRQQVLSFSILNNDGDDGNGNSSFRPAHSSGGDGIDSGVAAAAALAQAAAASGTAMALDEGSGPDAQLEQDMQRMHEDEVPTGAASSLMSLSGSRGSKPRYSNDDISMRD